MSRYFNLKLYGAKKLAQEFRRANRRVEDASAAGLYEEAIDLDSKSVPLVPVDKGRLRSTHYAAPPQKSGGKITGEVGYGTDYAVYVHERTELNHTVGQAKYLEQPAKEAKSGMPRRLADRAWGHFVNGTGVRAVQADAPKKPKDGE
jgi:hypothetical protein